MNTTKLNALKQKYTALTAQIGDANIIGTPEWTKICKEQSNLEPIIIAFDKYTKTQNDIASTIELINSETDPEMLELARAELHDKKEELEAITNELKILLLPRDPNDDKNVIFEIRQGAGGDEAGLFAGVLMRMYKMYAEANGLKTEDIDINATELGGIKEAIFSISGTDVYAKFKFESGVHRVQRVPTTETQGRIHTSTVTVAVLPEAEDIEVNIDAKDLRVDTYRSGGAGGQHVNKTESAIRITHIPTGIVVQCQDEKSQIKNREKAFKALNAKLYDHFKSEADNEYAQNRKNQVGTGDRSERIRTYNYPQGRVTDHRINFTLHSLPNFLNGQIEEMLEALRIADQTLRLEGEAE